MLVYSNVYPITITVPNGGQSCFDAVSLSYVEPEVSVSLVEDYDSLAVYFDDFSFEQAL